MDSLTRQSETNFEVVIVEDGSKETCQHVVEAFKDKLDVSYSYIPNGGPGNARNYGAKQSKGDYLIVLDSDCILPPDYIKSVNKELKETGADAFGGPDKASDSFTDVQKAINYSMTSFFTTGGIRGGKKKMDKFYPRSFNMGIRKSTYEALGGFSPMRFGEDIDFSIRLFKNGNKVCLFPSAWVYHKRRTDWHKFFRQVYNSGIAVSICTRNIRTRLTGTSIAGGLYIRSTLFPGRKPLLHLEFIAARTFLFAYLCGFFDSE